MSKQDNGGPAFPVNYSNEADGPTVMPSEGMALRDYFAAKAMQAQIVASMHVLSKKYTDDPDAVTPLIAAAAYEQADAMLKARDA